MQFDAVFNWQKTQTVTRSHERDTDFAAQSPNEACKNCPKIHGQTGGEYTKKPNLQNAIEESLRNILVLTRCKSEPSDDFGIYVTFATLTQGQKCNETNRRAAVKRNRTILRDRWTHTHPFMMFPKQYPCGNRNRVRVEVINKQNITFIRLQGRLCSRRISAYFWDLIA